MIDRPSLPANIEAEQALLGAILVNNQALASVAFLGAEHFTEPVHKAIFVAAATAIGNGRLADAKTLRSMLPAEMKIQEGLTLGQYLARLTAEATTIINAEDYGRAVLETATRRRLIVMADDIGQGAVDATDLHGFVAATIDQLNRLLTAARCNYTLRRTMFGEIEREPHKDWLVTGLLGIGEFSSFFGAPGSGKSSIVGDLAAHVAAGKRWFGRAVTAGAILYLAAERAAVVKRGFAAFRQHHSVDNLPLAVLAGLIDLRTSADVAMEIVAQAKDLERDTGQRVVLIVLDTYSRALAGGDENSPKDTGAVVQNVARVMEGTGAHFCVLHHMPVDGAKRLRGHGNLLGALDTGVLVDKVGATRVATVEKANDGPEGVTIGFDLESVTLSTDPDTNEATTASVVVPLDGPVAKPRPGRKLNDRQKLGLDTLHDICSDGIALPARLKLPSDIRAVEVASWQEELFSRGVLDRDSANPREDFRRLRDQLAARKLIGIREPMFGLFPAIPNRRTSSHPIGVCDMLRQKVEPSHVRRNCDGKCDMRQVGGPEVDETAEAGSARARVGRVDITLSRNERRPVQSRAVVQGIAHRLARRSERRYACCGDWCRTSRSTLG